MNEVTAIKQTPQKPELGAKLLYDMAKETTVYGLQTVERTDGGYKFQIKEQHYSDKVIENLQRDGIITNSKEEFRTETVQETRGSAVVMHIPESSIHPDIREHLEALDTLESRGLIKNQAELGFDIGRRPQNLKPGQPNLPINYNFYLPIYKIAELWNLCHPESRVKSTDMELGAWRLNAKNVVNVAKNLKQATLEPGRPADTVRANAPEYNA